MKNMKPAGSESPGRFFYFGRWGVSSRRLAPGGWLYETLAILASGFLATIRSLP
jgi:hypothetical protein